MVKKVMRKFRDIQEEYQVIDTKNATTKNTVQHRMLKLSIYTFAKTLKKEKKNCAKFDDKFFKLCLTLVSTY